MAQNHTKNTLSVCVKTSLSTSLHPPSPNPQPPVTWIPSASCNLFCCVVSEMSFFQWMWPPWIQHKCCPSLRRQVPLKKRGKASRWKMSQPKRQPWKPWNAAQNKKNETLSKDPLISLYVSIFLLHTPNRVSLVFLAKKAQAPNIEPPPPLHLPPPVIPPCRSSRSHSAPSSHRKATLEPSFWNLAAYSWKRSDRLKFPPRSEKTPRKLLWKKI